MRLESQIAAIDQDSLLIRYRVTNSGVDPVMVCDALLAIEPSGASQPDPERVYVVPDGEDGASIGKYIPVMPEGVLREAPELPLFREVPPGAALDGVARLSIPVRAYHPYIHPPGKVEVRLFRLRLTIGYIEHRLLPADRPVMRPYAAAPGFFVASYGNGVRYQKHLSNTLPLQGGGLPAIW